ncbi:hypothetical protein N657DRAFT_6681 [Parathielavia appendiculata]|uniref:Uncharacterized protein n=1 Tax=Parathielavia appendiculata TaxID=2587402 RepID=A0AAN6U8N3_9PEZI|nr:hypothetical protein N657DRAFT_6681 [Parathielavia appendiculata]
MVGWCGRDETKMAEDDWDGPAEPHQTWAKANADIHCSSKMLELDFHWRVPYPLEERVLALAWVPTVAELFVVLQPITDGVSVVLSRLPTSIHLTGFSVLLSHYPFACLNACCNTRDTSSSFLRVAPVPVGQLSQALGQPNTRRDIEDRSADLSHGFVSPRADRHGLSIHTIHALLPTVPCHCPADNRETSCHHTFRNPIPNTDRRSRSGCSRSTTALRLGVLLAGCNPNDPLFYRRRIGCCRRDLGRLTGDLSDLRLNRGSASPKMQQSLISRYICIKVYCVRSTEVEPK